MHHAGRGALAIAAGGLLAGFTSASDARADDLVTLSGKTYHDARPVRVEPDGVTWRYAEGVCKVDFADSPKSVREIYHYDAAKAASYHETQAQTQRQATEQGQQLVRAQEERQRVRATTQAQTAAAEAGPPTADGPTLVYRHGLAPAVQAAERALADQQAARDAQAAADARNSEGLGNPRLWSWIPGQGSQPVAPRMDIPNAKEYQATLKHPAGAFAESAAQDNFYQPIYTTKSYNEEMDRAAAFARGVPAK